MFQLFNLRGSETALKAETDGAPETASALDRGWAVVQDTASELETGLAPVLERELSVDASIDVPMNVPPGGKLDVPVNERLDVESAQHGRPNRMPSSRFQPQ